MYEIISLFVLIMLVLLSAFFSGAEVALVSIDRLEVKRFINEGKKNADILLKLKNKQRRILVTLLIGNNIVNISASSIAALFAIKFFGDIGLGIATFVMTILILIFGEVIPKTYCNRHYKEIVLTLAPIVYFIEKILYPFVSFFDFFAKLITKDKTPPPALTEKELKGFFEVGVQEKVLEPHERTMFEKILQFNDVQVDKIMIPYNMVIFLNADSTVLEASKIIAAEKYVRYPVFENKKQNVIGIVRGVDVLSTISTGEVGKKIREILWPPEFIDKSELIDDVFRKFKKKRVHVGIVRNKKQRVIGIITLEDLLEEIVGEFRSEDD